jgi:hypothetical protein
MFRTLTDFKRALKRRAVEATGRRSSLFVNRVRIVGEPSTM